MGLITDMFDILVFALIFFFGEFWILLCFAIFSLFRTEGIKPYNLWLEVIKTSVSTNIYAKYTIYILFGYIQGKEDVFSLL